MKMYCDEAMVLPSSYAVMSEDEMTYTEGGVSAKVKWWGIQINFTGRDAEGIGWALATGSGAAWLAAELHAPTVVGGVAWGVIAAGLSVATAAVGGINWLKKGKGFTYNHSWGGGVWLS